MFVAVILISFVLELILEVNTETTSTNIPIMFGREHRKL